LLTVSSWSGVSRPDWSKAWSVVIAAVRTAEAVLLSSAKYIYDIVLRWIDCYLPPFHMQLGTTMFVTTAAANPSNRSDLFSADPASNSSRISNVIKLFHNSIYDFNNRL